MSEEQNRHFTTASLLPLLRTRWDTERRRPRISRETGVSRKLEAAARLLDQGVKLVLLHGTTGDSCACKRGSSCSRPGKHPLTPHGVKDATNDPNIIRDALRVRPGLNLAVATGKASGVIVIDIDRRNGGEDSLAELETRLGPLPQTWIVITGNGAHLYFAYPADFDLPTRHAGELGAGLDLQSDGACAVMATSRHVNGRRYYAPRGFRPGDLPIASLPLKWLVHLRKDDKCKQPTKRSIQPPAGRVHEGGRNNHLTRIGGQMRNAGLIGDGLAAALAGLNREVCQPPLPEEDVATIAASLSRYAANARDGDEAEALVRAVLDEHFAGGEHLLFARDGRFWSYSGTHWQPLARPVLEHLILRTLRLRPKSRLLTTSLLKQAATLLEAERGDNADPLGFDVPPRPVVNCRNGELWLDELGRVERRPHDPRSYLRHCLDIDYDPVATCPRFDAALADIFSLAVPSKGMVRHWWELIGYLIQPRRDIPLIIICEGGGSNGKTKLVETFQRLLGAGLVSAMRIQDLDRSRFATSDLVGKLVLIDDDVRAAVRLPDGELKKISEAKTITAEHKNGPTFTFTVRTVPILLCNNPPSLADLSHGMRRRLMVIPFDRTFSEREIDRDLFPGIWDAELSGILIGALAGLARLAEHGWRFRKPAAVEAAEARWLGRANPVAEFVQERCREGSSTPTTELYEAYQAWCADNGVTYKQQRKAFKGNLEHLGYPAGRSAKARLTEGLSLR